VIYGRPTALWAGLLGALLNLVAIGWSVATNAELTPEMVALFAAINAVGLAVIGILANVAVNGSMLGRGDGQGRRV
jgi:hypothetical protein